MGAHLTVVDICTVHSCAFLSSLTVVDVQHSLPGCDTLQCSSVSTLASPEDSMEAREELEETDVASEGCCALVGGMRGAEGGGGVTPGQLCPSSCLDESAHAGCAKAVAAVAAAAL